MLPELLEPVELPPQETDDFSTCQEELLVAFDAACRLRKAEVVTVADVDHVWQVWQRYYAAGSVVHQPDKPVAWSATDVGFLALCRAWSLASDDDVSLDTIWHTWVHLVVIACQHTPESRTYWPTRQDWQRLKTEVALVTHTFLDTTAVKRVGILQQLDEQTQAENEATEVAQLAQLAQQMAELSSSKATEPRRGGCRVRPLPDTLKKLHQERLLPDSVRLQQEKDRKEAERLLEQGVKDVRIEASDEARGSLWRHSPLELVRNYVRLASRMVYKVERDHQLVHHYEHRRAPQFQAHVYQRVRAFVTSKCRVEMTDQASKLFRDTCNEWCQPLGAETDAWRNQQTRSDVSGAQAILRNEVGIDITQDLHTRTMLPPAKLAAASDDLVWPMLLVVLMHYDLLQTSGIDFLPTYVLVQSHTRAARQRLQDQWHKGYERLPLLVQAERRWWVHCFVYGSREADERAFWMYPCESLMHALVLWLWLVMTTKEGRDENGRSVRHLAERWLGNLDTCLMA